MAAKWFIAWMYHNVFRLFLLFCSFGCLEGLKLPVQGFEDVLLQRSSPHKQIKALPCKRQTLLMFLKEVKTLRPRESVGLVQGHE